MKKVVKWTKKRWSSFTHFLKNLDGNISRLIEYLVRYLRSTKKYEWQSETIYLNNLRQFDITSR